MWTPRPHRVVRLSTDYDYLDYAGLQLNFMDQKRHRILPSTRVYIGERLVFESNALGCKGAELAPDLPIVGVFGDSVVQGGGADSFVDFVRIAGSQPLNGGLEGSTIAMTVDRVLDIHARAPMVCAAVHSGWHNLIYNDTTEAHWREHLDRIVGPPVIAHFRLTCDFHPEVLEKGYDRFWQDAYYWPWQANVTTAEKMGPFMEQVARFNTFIEAYCAETGRLLIDLDPVLAPPTYDHVSEKFLDLIHPRAQVYDLIGQEISRQLEPRLRPRLGAVPAKAASTVRGPATDPRAALVPTEDKAGKALQDIGRTYPLW